VARRAIAYRLGPEPATGSHPPDGIEIIAAEHDRGDAPGPRLALTLERIAAGEGETLVVERLSDVAGSLGDLLALLDWLEAARADLVALDVGLDSRSRAGQQAVTLIREIGDWERAPRSGRPRAGRPGLARHAPELGERIAAMRAEGLSLQAIANRLNEERVPTPRGGSMWRPSSVQAALGYRRPRPPVPGAPPPPPTPPAGRHQLGLRGRRPSPSRPPG
jgi:Resolvase, N terminal domain/Recombinase